MKKHLLVATWLFLPILGHTALVMGQFRNASPGTVIEVFVPHRYLDGQDSHYRGELDGQLQFSIEVEVLEPQLAFIVFNDDRLTVFLAKEDTLSIKGDAFQFPMMINFSGNAAENNKVLQSYVHQNRIDFNDFNNIRFKIGQYWTSVEMALNEQMESLYPIAYKSYIDSVRMSSLLLLEQNAPALTADFEQWFNAEVTYSWAYALLVYGQVYAGRYGIQPDFFDFLYEAPMISESIGNEQYRQFLLAFMARQQVKAKADSEPFWAGQYYLAGKLLSGKSLSYFRSEMINIAFSVEKFQELLPLYTNFMQSNRYPVYESKVEGLYQKYARVLPGAFAPAFHTMDADGKEISLSQFQGKVVYLNFWASWCGACLRKMEYMDGFQSDLAKDGIETVNISIDENVGNWRNALELYQFKGRQLLAHTGSGLNIANIYGVEAVPQYFIIGRNGAFIEKVSSSQPAEIIQQLHQLARKQ